MLRTLSRLNPVRAVRSAQRIINALDRLPQLEAKVEQCVVAYEKDALFADRVAAFQAAIDVTVIQRHVRGVVAAAALEREPCPYVVLENLLPEEFYDEMLRALPPRVFFKPYPHDPTREELQVPFGFAPAYSRLVWDFFVTRVVEETLVPAAAAANSTPPARGGTHASCRASRSEMPTGDRGAGVSRTPDAAGECELVRDVPGARNSALIFLNSTGAHGASVPPDAPAELERYVYQAQFSPGDAAKQRLIDLLSGERRTGWTAKSGRSY